ncbi:MAG: hemerythrin domain-containing protein [Chromatiaceae bacterium]
MRGTMSALLVWRDSWLLGIDELDADHREMVRLLNDLCDGAGPDPGATPPAIDGDSTSGGSRPSLEDRLTGAVAHLRAHFEREERFLATIGYPGIEEHRREHSLQMAEFVDLQRVVAAVEADHLGEEAAEGIKRWFFNHVIAEDLRFADFYFRELLGQEPRNRTHSSN